VPAMTSLAFGICLRATPQRVCQALADPVLVPDWLSGMSSGPAGEEDPRRLTCEWLLADCLEINGGCVSVVRFDLAAMGQVTRLTVSHRGLDPGGSLLKVITPAWPMILSSLKSLVETGEPLEFRLSA
jgi:hypothetical protein